MLFNKILVFLSNSSDNDVLAEEMGELTRFSRGLLVAVRPKIISRDFPEDASLNDLNIKDQYNTYYIQGLPPTPICYVSRKTIELVLENYNSEYLFYFYNDKLKKHLFSKSFYEHKKKLNISFLF